MEHWPQRQAWFWETAPFFRIVVPFAVGIVWYNSGVWQWHTVSLQVGCIAVLLLCAGLLEFAGKGGVAGKRIVPWLVYLSLFLSGNCLSAINDVRNNPAWFGRHLDRQALYLARIAEPPIEKSSTWKLNVTVLNTLQNGAIIPLRGNALLYLYKGGQPVLLHQGDSILVPGNWQPITNSGNPFEFDYAAYCRQANITMQQFCMVEQTRLYAKANEEQESITESIHAWSSRQLEKYFTNPRTCALMQAMILGDVARLDPELLQSYADTGIIHVIAISGSNVMLFFTFIGFTLWFMRHKKHRWIHFLIALPLVWIYVIMAGCAPSAIRAAFMFTLLAFGQIFEQNENSLNQLFAAAFLLLCAEPMWLFSVGFQMSFVAVLSLILFYGPIFGLVQVSGKYIKFKNAIWETIAASIAAEILVAPLSVCYFHNFPWLFIVANVIAFLFMEAVLYAGITVIVLGQVPYIPVVIAFLTHWMVIAFDWLILQLQKCNPESFHYLKLTVPELLVLYVAIGGIAFYILRKKTKVMLVAVAALCIVLILLCADKFVSIRQAKFVVFNTGKSSHIEIIRGNNYSVFCTDTSRPALVAYATKPAHTMWQAWQPADQNPPSGLLMVAGKKILVLTKPLAPPEPIPVNYLIVNYKCQPEPSVIIKSFSPQKLILGNTCEPSDWDKWQTACDAAHLPLHIVPRDGAFVVE